MDFELDENQAIVQDAVLGIFEPYRPLPPGASAFFLDAPELEQTLAESGFFEIAKTEGYGALDAALLAFEAARLPVRLEVTASALVAPHITSDTLPRPIALATDRSGVIRNLPGAKTLLWLENGVAKTAALEGQEVEILESVLAYPFGRLVDPSSLSVKTLGEGSGKALVTWWQVGLAVEAAGLAKAALDATVEYVTIRTQFNRPLGSFQAVQHRLATCAQIVSAMKWLAFRAAESGSPEHAALAALYAQDQMRQVINDLHQFTGAIGLTLEYPLHLWTYRLKALQGELGGVAGQAEAMVGVFEDAA
jgi:Acyl-CoA dehydrogenase, C-terminal domain